MSLPVLIHNDLCHQVVYYYFNVCSIKVKLDCFIFYSVSNNYTVSVALPGSILENAQSPELRTYLAGQVIKCSFLYSLFLFTTVYCK